MTTYTACVKHIKKARAAGDTNTRFITHVTGQVDRRGIDRGFTVAIASDLTISEDVVAVVDSLGHLTALKRAV